MKRAMRTAMTIGSKYSFTNFFFPMGSSLLDEECSGRLLKNAHLSRAARDFPCLLVDWQAFVVEVL